MAVRWFVSQNDRVYGPWSTEDVQTHRRQGNVTDADLIWGNGGESWVALAKWKPMAAAAAAAPTGPIILATRATSPKPSAAPTRPVQINEAATRPVRVAEEAATRLVATKPADDAETRIVSLAAVEDEVTRSVKLESVDTAVTTIAGEVWHYALNGSSFGPFGRPQLMTELKRLPNLHGVSLWTRGMREWIAAFEFHDIATELGMNLREHPRAAIDGRAVCTYEGLTLVAPLASISEGGLGLRLDSEFFAGQLMKIEIQSNALGSPIVIESEVRFCANGIVGLRFKSPAASVKSQIASYVRKHPPTAAAA